MKALSTLLLLLILASSMAFAQSKRMTLIEEGTNASCPPCARENPTFEKYLVKPHIMSRVIPLVYHASWPGRDVMYSANTAMHTGRIVTYYAINGVPTITVNGRFPTKVTGGWNGAPSDTTAINNELAKAQGLSPITIGVTETVNGSNVDVAVTVSSTAELTNKKLHIAVTEGYHYYANAGTNGEKEFMYIARKMLPDHLGTTFSLAANDTRTFNQSFTYDTAWTASEMYIVAFVQDDATKEVLQAGTDRVHLEMNTSAQAQVTAREDQPGLFNATLSSAIAGEYTVDVEKTLPTGWSVELTVNGNAVTPPAKIALEKDVVTNLDLKIIPVASKNRLGKAVVTVRGPFGGSGHVPFRLYARDITTLVLVKDEGNAAIATAYQSGMERNTYTYALVEPGDENVLDLKTFPTVLWEVGKNVLSQSDVTVLKSYLDGPAPRLFLLGAEIAWGLADPASSTSGWYMDVPFLNNYLHADYVADDHAATNIIGAPGDPVGNGINVAYNVAVTNQDTPDVLRPRDGGVPVFFYGTTTDVAAFRWENSRSKLLYFGLGIEGISAVVTRGEILRRGIEWLLGPTGTGDLPAAPSGLAISVHPNPVSGAWSVPVALDAAATVRLALYDMTGRLVSMLGERELPAGTTTLGFDASKLAEGSYMLHVTAGGRAQSTILHVTR